MLVVALFPQRCEVSGSVHIYSTEATTLPPIRSANARAGFFSYEHSVKVRRGHAATIGNRRRRQVVIVGASSVSWPAWHVTAPLNAWRVWRVSIESRKT